MPMIIGSNDRLKKLERIIMGLGPVAVCLSGGMDSAFLLWVCSRIMPKEDLRAVTFTSATTPAREIKQAMDTALLYEVQQIVFPGPEMNNQDFLQNNLLRCYYCKRERLNFLLRETEIRTRYKILDGSVIDDLKAYRPGRRALEEAGITTPMLEAEISKQDIRSLGSQYNLGLVSFVNESCLATRIKTGQPISETILDTIAAGENIMHQLGFQLVRVRWNYGEVRLEIDPQELSRAFQLRGQISESLRQCGLEVVSLDIQDYKSEGG